MGAQAEWFAHVNLLPGEGGMRSMTDVGAYEVRTCFCTPALPYEILIGIPECRKSKFRSSITGSNPNNPHPSHESAFGIFV